MASNKKITKVTTSVRDIIKICDTQIEALQYLDGAIRTVVRVSIEQLHMTKIAAAKTLARREPPKNLSKWSPAQVKEVKRLAKGKIKRS